MAATAWIVAHVRRAAEAGQAATGDGGRMPVAIHLQVAPMNRSTAYCPASWHIMRLERMEPSRPVKNTSGRWAM